jgi:multidrug efflux pump
MSNDSRHGASATGPSTLFYRNRTLLVLAIFVIVIGGLSALNALPRIEDPRITNRVLLIITNLPGASAERIETLITEPLERGLQEVSGIKRIESTSSSGTSLIKVVLLDSVGPNSNKQLFSELRDKVSQVATQFPANTLPPLVDDKRGTVAFTLLTAVGWNGTGAPNLTIMNRAAEELANRLRTVNGTELVRLYAAPAEQISVQIDRAASAASGLTLPMIANQLRSADVKQPAGVLHGGGSDINIEVSGQLDSVARIAALPLVAGSRGDTIRLGDIGTIERSWQQPLASVGLVDSRQVIYVAARMDETRRIDRWATEANAVVDKLQQELGSGIALQRIFEQERYTTGLLNDLTANLVAGAAVVVAVVFIMMGWQLALIVGSVLPLVVCVVLLVFQINGTAIHQMSIFGMIISIGLMIDNAIVVADEILQRRRRGVGSLAAVQQTIHHLFVPLLASTLTTALAFAPILLLPGNAGDFVGSIGSTVIIAIIASFIIAITLIAALAGIFTHPDISRDRHWWQNGIHPAALTEYYRRGLLSAMRNPAAAIVLAVSWPLLGFVAASGMGKEFFPPVDRDMFQVQVTLPADASVASSRAVAARVEHQARQFEEVESVWWMVGGSFPTVYYNLTMNRDGAANYADAVIKTTSSDAAKAMIAPLQNQLNEAFPEAQIVIRQFGQGPPVVTDIEYRLYGPSVERLQQLGEQLRLALQADPDVVATNVTLPRGEPKLWFDVDEDQARLAGLSLSDIATQLAANTDGAVGGMVLENLEQLPVRVRYRDDQRNGLDAIAAQQLITPRGDAITATALGDFVLRPELGGMTRYNAQRTNRVQAYTRNGALPIDVTYRVLASLDRDGFQLPNGYRLELGGALEQDADTSGDLLIYIPLLITLTLATLILLFRNLFLAALLGSVALLSVGLGLFATWTMGYPIGFNTFLGILGLIGLAFNNSIVVLASIRADAAARAADSAALVAATIGCTRHILSTTLTTIGGFLPLLIFVEGDFWPSISIVLVGGVGGSMILALLMVPAAYKLRYSSAG